MSESTANGWTEEQWTEVRQCVEEEARRSRVAAGFLPLYGPVPRHDFTVPQYKLEAKEVHNADRGETHQRLVTDEVPQLVIATIAVEVYLRGGENADPELQAAKTHFRRAANIIARAEDALVFSGQKNVAKHVGPPIWRITGGSDAYPGLVDANDDQINVPGTNAQELGQSLVSSVVSSIQRLEGKGFIAPHVCVLGNDLYTAAMTPRPESMVLPADRINPFLSQPVMRTSTLADDTGLVISLAGAPIELVVATDLHVDFLQVSLEPRFIYRVSERVILRIKEAQAVVRLKSAKGKKK